MSAPSLVREEDTIMSPKDSESAIVYFARWNDLYNSEKPFMLFMDIPSSAQDRRFTNVEFCPAEIAVQNIRGKELDFELDTHGFKIANLGSPARFADPESLQSKYLPALEDLLRNEVAGVDRVFFFDWRRNTIAQDLVRLTEKRRNAKEQPSPPGADKLGEDRPSAPLQPAITAHVDQAPIAALNRVREELGSDADCLLEGRVRIINIWRPIVNPVLDWPLALCDGKTVHKTDFLDVDQVRENHVGSSMFMMLANRMRWYYLKAQRPHEVLLFKQFDSLDQVDARFCPHVAFKHKHIPEGAPPRESVEVRALVFTEPKNGPNVH